MNLVLAAVGGVSIAFLLRFLLALRSETRMVCSTLVSVIHDATTSPLPANEL